MVPLYFDNPFVINQVARYTVLAMLAVSVSLVWGYGGILSLGQGLAFGIAAYGMAHDHADAVPEPRDGSHPQLHADE